MACGTHVDLHLRRQTGAARHIQNQALIRTKAARHFERIHEIARAADRQSDRLVTDTADSDRKLKPGRPVTRKLNESIRPQPSPENETGVFSHRRPPGPD